MQWRVLTFERGEPESLLRRGTELLDDLADDPVPTLRWYRATQPALVLGRGQPQPVAEPGALPVVTRFSGGGAVLLDEGLLSLDVLVPTGHPLLDGDIGLIFEHVGDAWAEALADLGVRNVVVHRGAPTARRRGNPHEQLLAAICYASLGRGEVLASGRKVVGLAQRRRRPGALVQCGLLRRWNPAPLLAAFGGDPTTEDVLHGAVGLDDLLDDPPSDAVVMDAVERRLVGVGNRHG
jgi:lipoate-protein ligase A